MINNFIKDQKQFYSKLIFENIFESINKIEENNYIYTPVGAYLIKKDNKINNNIDIFTNINSKLKNHTSTFGTTGRGKSVFLEDIFYSDLLNKIPNIVKTLKFKSELAYYFFSLIELNLKDVNKSIFLLNLSIYKDVSYIINTNNIESFSFNFNIKINNLFVEDNNLFKEDLLKISYILETDSFDEDILNNLNSENYSDYIKLSNIELY